MVVDVEPSGVIVWPALSCLSERRVALLEGTRARYRPIGVGRVVLRVGAFLPL